MRLVGVRAHAANPTGTVSPETVIPAQAGIQVCLSAHYV